MVEKIKGLVIEEEGQGMAEYGLILAGVALAVVVTIGVLGDQIDSVLNAVKNALPTAP